MGFVFKSTDFRKIARILGTTPKQKKNNVRFELEGNSPAQRLSLEIYSNLVIGNRRGNLITVYTPSSHLQLHFCSGYVLSSMLGEVTFIGEHNGKLSGLIVERDGGCSLYANVDRQILSGDFTRLGPEVMLSGIALSLSEPLLPRKSVKKNR